jgi:hypothetical protein
MISRIPIHLTGFPSLRLEPLTIQSVDLNPQRKYDGFTATPARQTDIALWTRRGADQQVHLRQEFDVIPHFDRRRFGEVPMCILGKAGTHEDVQNVVDVPFGQSILQGLTCKVGMTAVIHVLSRHGVVGVGIAPTADDVVDARAILVESVVDRIFRDRRHAPQIRHVAPQPVATLEMRRVNLSRLAGIKMLLCILQRPTIHVGHLGSLRADDPPQTSGRNLPG